MNLTKEPSIDTKILKMRERVRWQHSQIAERQIDQTKLTLGEGGESEFSFLVIGDSGTGHHHGESPQREVAKQLLLYGQDAKFILHTGDVVYLIGSSEQYLENFIKPYREFLVGGDNPRAIAYDKMVFKLPFFPVLGNHDYYDISPVVGLFGGLSFPLRYLLRSYINLDIGWHGSFQGDAYARAFLDYLQKIPESQLGQHLDRYYTTEIKGKRCLNYQPGYFTRLPNRYYTFHYGGIDFFALDSNTFNQPLSGDNPAMIQELKSQSQELQEYLKKLLRNLSWQNNQEDLDNLTEEIEEIDERINDINKQLNNVNAVDQEQLKWLEKQLIASCQNPQVRGRILFFHHPAYVTEASKWSQGQTLAVRHHLRGVFKRVASVVGQKPLVNLILSGHAHCLEYLRTESTGEADANLNWLICGGSGYSLRRQKSTGPEIREIITGKEQIIAKSHLFLGRSGKGLKRRKPYSAVRIDVKMGEPLKLVITPLVAERYQGKWERYCLKSLVI